MTILITGGAGYVGYSLTRSLIKHINGLDKIIIYDNLSRRNYAFFTGEKIEGSVVSFVHGEILDAHKLNKILENVDIVFHLAAKVIAPTTDYNSHAFDQVNHWGTSALVDAVEKADIRHFIYLSSTSVYGSTKKPADEQYSPAPDTVYGISKLKGEQQVNRLNSKTKIHTIRSGNVYGYNPAFRIDAVLNRFMFEAHFNNKIFITGDGKQIRSFIHVDKLAYVLTQLVTGDLPPGTYNMVEHTLSVNHLVDIVRELYPDIEYQHINQNAITRHINVSSPAKISKFISFPSKALKEELEDFRGSFSFLYHL